MEINFAVAEMNSAITAKHFAITATQIELTEMHCAITATQIELTEMMSSIKEIIGAIKFITMQIAVF